MTHINEYDNRFFKAMDVLSRDENGSLPALEDVKRYCTDHFLDLIGQTADPQLAEEIIFTLSTNWKYFLAPPTWELQEDPKRELKLDKQTLFLVRSERSVEAMAKCIRHMRYAANRTYENTRLFSGITFVDFPDAFEARIRPPGRTDMSRVHDIIRFDTPKSVGELSDDQFLELLQLTDGKHTLLWANAFGEIVGIVDFGNEHISGFGDITLLLDRHGTITISNRDLMPFTFDGFEWRRSWERDAIRLLGNLLPFPVTGLGSRKANNDQLSRAIEFLSEFRLSSLVAVTTQSNFERLNDNGQIVPMRAELQPFAFDDVFGNPVASIPILRQDGAHLLDANLKPLGLCQRIVVDDKTTGSSGSGTNAAAYLSSELGEGIVIKVSSDGPIKIFLNGERLTKSKFLKHSRPEIQ